MLQQEIKVANRIFRLTYNIFPQKLLWYMGGRGQDDGCGSFRREAGKRRQRFIDNTIIYNARPNTAEEPLDGKMSSFIWWESVLILNGLPWSSTRVLLLWGRMMMMMIE